MENSNFTCIGAKNEQGGTNIDYFIISRALLAAVRSILVDTNVPWAPQYGIALKFAWQLRKIQIMTLTPPDLPKNIKQLGEQRFENNELQQAKKPTNKIAQKQLQAAKQFEIKARERRDDGIWKALFKEVSGEEIKIESRGEANQAIIDYYEQMTGELPSDSPLTKNFAIWAGAVQQQMVHTNRRYRKQDRQQNGLHANLREHFRFQTEDERH